MKSNYPEHYKKSIYELHKSIKEAKREFQTKLESQGVHMDTCQLCQDLQSVTGFKVKWGSIADNNMSLPNKLNAFYDHFEQKIDGRTSPGSSASGAFVPIVIVVDVRSAFLRVNP